MNQSNWELEAQNDLGYGQLFATLWNRRYWFLGVFGSVLAIGVPLSLMKQPIYQSMMQVLPESNYQTSTRTSTENQYLESQFTDTSVEIDYVTQLKVFKSSEILKKVIGKLGLQDSELTEVELIEALRESLNVSQIIDENAGSKDPVQTKIIQVVYFGDDPLTTQTVLEAIQEVYLEYNLEQQEQRLKNGLAFVDRQIPQAQAELKEAESALTELSKEYNVIAPEEEAIALKQNITDISQERAALRAERNQTVGNSQTLQQKLGLDSENSVTFSRLSQSERYQNLLNELQAIEIELAAKRTQHQDSSPIVRALLDRRDSQKDLLVNEAERILGQLPANFGDKLDLMLKQGQLVDSDTEFADEILESEANLSGIDERETALAETEAQLRQRLAEFPELLARYRDLTQETEVKREALQRLREAKQELEIELNRGGFNWQVIEPPLLGEQIGPNLKKDLLLCIVIASFLGVSAAFIRETLDERIFNLKAAERQTKLPVLGSTPSLSLPSSNNFLGQLPFSSRSQSCTSMDVIQWQPFREALDVIYENLRLSGVTSSFHSLAITSATAGEGKSTFVLGLALSVARHRKKVLVIDADLRRSCLHQAFNLPNRSGLADYLSGEIDLPKVQRISVLGESVDLICSGAVPQDPVKLLCSTRLEKLIEDYEQHYDLIIVDTPPAIGMVDAIKVASVCDSSLLMMRLNQLKTSELSEAEALLSKLNVLGIVANNSKEYETKTPYLLAQSV